MNYRILRHPDTAYDLQSIAQLISEFAGPAIALKKLNDIETSIRKLSETPYIGSIRNDIYPNLRAIPTARKGVVTFVIDEQNKIVQIVSITYAGADWITRFSERNSLKEHD